MGGLQVTRQEQSRQDFGSGRDHESEPLTHLTLLHVNSQQCLDMPSEEEKTLPALRDCSGQRSQQWILRNMTLGV
ncbi:hypothetical protein DNTS_008879 [Danionella cerebrum]|uniref:Uncharacterized protein n=1 Tax=Danionella cerebrum TaxID=2873325 RepID=A0A553MVT1_9TELE|nr:hypothetical protein DNTS_008879 [Danionella translucida]